MINKLVNIMIQHREVTQLHWGIFKLLELGVSEKIVKDLSENEITDLVKGLLYLKERYKNGL
jgi:transposase